ncbi:MAG TPA: hypothetical protein VFA18_23085 [Gemmataceae bacterium]|nr:hypothetical protein [Gemmataceae bacterium]
MSRAYRIRVRESLRRTLRATDRVSSQLELLQVLPAEDMAALLAEELKRRGFQEQGPKLVRQGGGITVTIEPASGTVTVQAEAADQVVLQGERQGAYYEDNGPGHIQTKLRQAIQGELEEQAKAKQAELQKDVTARLEGQLADLQQELDQVVNRVTAEALKRKAAQIGQIKELTEDPQNGSLTIVLEV